MSDRSRHKHLLVAGTVAIGLCAGTTQLYAYPDTQAECDEAGGAWVVNSSGAGFCYLKLEPIRTTLDPIDQAGPPSGAIDRASQRAVDAALRIAGESDELAGSLEAASASLAVWNQQLKGLEGIGSAELEEELAERLRGLQTSSAALSRRLDGVNGRMRELRSMNGALQKQAEALRNLAQDIRVEVQGIKNEARAVNRDARRYNRRFIRIRR